MAASKQVRSALESMMFVWGEPLAVRTAADVLNVSEAETKEAFEALMEEYDQEQRGIRVRRINKGYQFVTAEENGTYIERLCTPVKRRRLSQSALEVLAIIAYKQPVTRAQIEKIRGVSCDHAINRLLEYGLISEAGRLDAPGRPILFGTTEEFLRHFGTDSLDDLPRISPVKVEDFKAEAEEEARLKLEV